MDVIPASPHTAGDPGAAHGFSQRKRTGARENGAAPPFGETTPSTARWLASGQAVVRWPSGSEVTEMPGSMITVHELPSVPSVRTRMTFDVIGGPRKTRVEWSPAILCRSRPRHRRCLRSPIFGCSAGYPVDQPEDPSERSADPPIPLRRSRRRHVHPVGCRPPGSPTIRRRRLQRFHH